tara:strand:+ start:1400 stop:1591 length:192 start_codon:yes stop_codon:yes gene_type:complete
MSSFILIYLSSETGSEQRKRPVVNDKPFEYFLVLNILGVLLHENWFRKHHHQVLFKIDFIFIS